MTIQGGHVDLQELLRKVLEWPTIHQAPDRAAARELWDMRSKEERQRQDMPALQALHTSLGNEHPTTSEAITGILSRISQRSRSMSATLVFVGFLVASQVALIGYGVVGNSGYMHAAVAPTILGLIVIFWGMLPTFGSLFPSHRDDEAQEALNKTRFDWYLEAATRSSSQRNQLWRLRVAMAISLPLTSFTLLMFLV